MNTSLVCDHWSTTWNPNFCSVSFNLTSRETGLRPPITNIINPGSPSFPHSSHLLRSHTQTIYTLKILAVSGSCRFCSGPLLCHSLWVSPLPSKLEEWDPWTFMLTPVLPKLAPRICLTSLDSDCAKPSQASLPSWPDPVPHFPEALTCHCFPACPKGSVCLHCPFYPLASGRPPTPLPLPTPKLWSGPFLPPRQVSPSCHGDTVIHFPIRLWPLGAGLESRSSCGIENSSWFMIGAQECLAWRGGWADLSGRTVVCRESRPTLSSPGAWLGTCHLVCMHLLHEQRGKLWWLSLA